VETSGSSVGDVMDANPLQRSSWPGKSAKRVFALDVRPSTSCFLQSEDSGCPGTTGDS
jgi:hypothetical protein